MTKEVSEELPVIRASTLTAIPTIDHAFFTRHGGVSTGIYRSLNCGFGSDDQEEKVSENRRRVCECLGVSPASLVSVYQVHGTNVVTVEKPWDRHAAPKADGMVTRQTDLALGILTADCTPVLFADPKAGVIGACHAGWRGALDGVVETTVAAMETLGASRNNTVAAIGPCIAQKSYQVGLEFRDQFTKHDPNFSDYFIDDDDTHLRFDLGGFIEHILDRAEIAIYENVNIDNCAEVKNLFSYRRATLTGEKDYGRGLSAITLRNWI
ncbi:MAG: peptidoglycan editing factor PgeF [Alphaproteobacteria bacterium]|nr:peptidoglycan editing factor PgeF [Alphaproteobacteria bacterium]